MLPVPQRQVTSLWLTVLCYALTARAQSGDGGNAEGFQNSNLGTDAADGADGSSRSSANLSKGAIIAIAVVVAVVVIGGSTLAVLFYLAKKRQWQIRQSIRRTTTKVVRAMTPRTPHFPKSPKIPKEEGHSFVRRRGDVEKGFQSIDEQLRTSEESSNGKTKPKNNNNNNNAYQEPKGAAAGPNKPKVKPSNIAVPGSAFEMDSPKSPMWQRVFGRA